MTGPDPRIGTVLHERYRVLERIAEGGMGSVYRGERVKLGRAVAIKFLHEAYAASPDGMRRFEVEARAMSRVAHPNCVPVTDFGVDRGAPYLVMDFVPGRSLRQLLSDEGRLAPARAVAIARQVLAGLAHAHGQGIVHRDIKPENILCTHLEGHGEQVRILDFGLARLREDATFTSGLALGTPGYMSPEQTLGRPADARADLYATGILLHELIAGQKPFVADSPLDVMRLHRDMPPPPLRQVAPDAGVSEELEAVVLRALAKSPDERFPSAGAFSDALQATPEVDPLGGRRSEEPARSRAGRRGLLLAAAAVIGAGAVVGVGALRGGGDAPAGTAPPDAAAVVMEFEPEPPEAEIPPDPPDVERLRARAARGGRSGAIRALQKIRVASPDRAEVHFALGNLYSDAMWYSDAIEAYRMAIALRPAYARQVVVARDLVAALASDRSHGAAARLIESKLGAFALPQLEAAAKAARDPAMRARAERLRARLAATDGAPAP